MILLIVGGMVVVIIGIILGLGVKIAYYDGYIRGLDEAERIRSEVRNEVVGKGGTERNIQEARRSNGNHHTD